jgi:hypothetical protein
LFVHIQDIFLIIFNLVYLVTTPVTSVASPDFLVGALVILHFVNGTLAAKDLLTDSTVMLSNKNAKFSQAIIAILDILIWHPLLSLIR